MPRLYVKLGDKFTDSTTPSNMTVNLVEAMYIDNINTAVSINSTIYGETFTWWRVSKPSASNTTALTTDGKYVYIQQAYGNTNISVPIDMVIRNMSNLVYVRPTSTSTPSSKVYTLMIKTGLDLVDITNYTPITLDQSIPLAFKRANTVVNLGRL